MKVLTRYFPAFTLLSILLQGLQPSFAAQAPDLDTYRRHSLTHEGNVERGKKLFNDEQKLGCSKCHSVDGSASKAGPDLFAVGDAFGRRDIVESVLQPSATIVPGYGTFIVETKAGAVYQGILKRTTDDVLQIMGADGKLVSIPTGDIKEKRGSSVSLMPEGLQANLSLEQFTRPQRSPASMACRPRSQRWRSR